MVFEARKGLFITISVTIRHFYIQNIVLFRINADDNDLSWPFRVDKYPSLVYFPARDKAESIPYPPHLPVTLRNLVQFVRHAAGPTADIGVCSWICMQTNLRTVAVIISQLQSERSRLLHAINRLRSELKAMFVEPLMADGGHDPFELNSPTEEALQSISQSTTSDKEADDFVDTEKFRTVSTMEHNYDESTHSPQDLDLTESAGNAKQRLSVNNIPNDLFLADSDSGVDTAKARTTSMTEQNYEQLAAHLAEDLNSGELSYSNNMPKGLSGGVAWRWCSVEHLLRMRDELAWLRRQLHVIDVKGSLLRHLHSYVLLPAVVHGSSQLERRRWRTIHRLKLVTSLRLRNYVDLVSGTDKGS